MNIKVIAIALLLTGCVNTRFIPVYVMPTAPAALTAPLPELQQIQKPNGTTDEPKK